MAAGSSRNGGESDKTRRRMASELAAASGRALYAETAAGPDGIRRILRRSESLGDESRSEAQAFTSAGPAIFLAVAEDPPSVLLACSKDSGTNAGDWLKRALAEAGGRGGGNPTLAQGSLPSKESLSELAPKLAGYLGIPTFPA